MEIKIIRSPRRRRTVAARLINDCLVVRAPCGVSNARLDEIVARFKETFEKRKIRTELTGNQPLAEVAQRLNKEYFGGTLCINSIEYVTNQNAKYGCCDYRKGNIRISHKVGLMPSWVRDYVIIHEMAHLREPNHSRAFWNIVSRYKLFERARGFLIAQGFLSRE
ncbi:MAG: M48 family metallopeptidase [Candidatus Omnitrophota bacterium]|nr:M48 family metallopeptidase [Candidatus Omnitrophota bacterium]